MGWSNKKNDTPIYCSVPSVTNRPALYLGRLEDQHLIALIKVKLTSKPCSNQGFVLDGFPKTYDQAKELFGGELLA